MHDSYSARPQRGRSRNNGQTQFSVLTLVSSLHTSCSNTSRESLKKRENRDVRSGELCELLLELSVQHSTHLTLSTMVTILTSCFNMMKLRILSTQCYMFRKVPTVKSD